MKMTVDQYWDKWEEWMNQEEPSFEKWDGLEKLLNIAQQEGDLYKEFCCRFGIMRTVNYLGEYEELFDHFEWCSGFFLDNEENLQDWVEYFFWIYKWMAEHLVKMPGISTELIQSFFDDFKEAYEKYGYSLRPYYQHQHKMALKTGDMKGAKKYYSRWIEAERDALADCEACEYQTQLEYFHLIGEIDKAEPIEKLLLSKEVSCGEIPHLTYSKLLLPYLEGGRIEEAARYQSEGYFFIYDKPHFLVEASEHIRFLAMTDPVKGIKVLERHIEYADSAKDPYGMFYFYMSGVILHRKLIEAGHRPGFAVDMMTEIAEEIAGDFDERNGNDFFSREMEKIYAM
ncbi:hypothetical protein [Bacillus sp. KH172YL63]|uniref:hypothetical protein n=1 Tax=Bacillus sp. KH172YL63 TaxID=2709784 RepID=UPI0013E49D0D|nr:hypothetical protein [Bacillus sp. KH172YL63]BCB02470.1 hypothetical protein KH172YL63_06030 [Bacillus sp. KH172YL63]